MEKSGDAGLKGLDHCEHLAVELALEKRLQWVDKSRLPAWRYAPRQWLLPFLRKETIILDRFQKAIRTPALDSYFAITANLGTLTFYMVFLPVLFWSGYTSLARAVVHILAAGVFLSGFIKDMLCLPRPLSPPLVRITHSGSAALEYGFPSSHSTNAVSVAVYSILLLRNAGDAISPGKRISLEILVYLYASSIALGRIYCGMHGFIDVIVGSILGALISVVEFYGVRPYEVAIMNGSWETILAIALVILVLIRIHPEPADDCPCFDDSVAFAAVYGGIELGNWQFAKTDIAWTVPGPATVPYSWEVLGLTKSIVRILLGVVCVVVWREIAKPALLRSLPPVFRIIDRLGLILPRRYFKPATEYDQVPIEKNTDSVVPPVSEIPEFLSRVAHPRRARSISIGPQSAADAHEALALRREMRQERRQSGGVAASGADRKLFLSTMITEEPKALPKSKETPFPAALPTPSSSSNDLLSAVASLQRDSRPLTPEGSSGDGSSLSRTPSQDRREERELFSQISKPRVRYDVEVITKLIVYGGIAHLATFGCPVLFHYVGLSVYD